MLKSDGDDSSPEKVTHTSKIYQAINKEYETRLEDDRTAQKNDIRAKMIKNLNDYIKHIKKQMKE